MTTVEVFAPAKVNLSLHVTGKRSDGYHELDSLVVFAHDIGDVVTLTKAYDISLTVSGMFSEGVPTDEANLVLKAARLLKERRGVAQGARIELRKDLPNGAGIGGGSADAAAALRGLVNLWQVEPLSLVDALSLGADVPVCLCAPKSVRMRGIGDDLEEITGLPTAWLVLVNPGVHVPTGEVFGRLAAHFSVENPGMAERPESDDHEAFAQWLHTMRNDLKACMEDYCVDVLECIQALQPLDGCIKADMSGSGSTCWGFFWNRDKAIAAANLIALQNPNWWVRTTSIMGQSEAS